ncbi:hypothetical protein PZ897_18410 [Hoeflea sp. YIM 152468]|uniref:hypothetical protein n=1 Tax=Hoeflea sp. YIM 152468 TaxID=3031759 RepID=UPI0023DC986E|nr:hypothetical protein [Hoeflea sp. YIM 152468]MDF1610160.1 hypothetical protein [Hoeflea sp. YIM 152468]
MRFVARTLSLVFLVCAVLAGLVDAIKSVAAGRLVLSPLAQSWSSGSPETLALLENLSAQYLPAWVWDPGVAWVLMQPACVVLLALSLLFYLAGYRRARLAGRFAA